MSFAAMRSTARCMKTSRSFAVALACLLVLALAVGCAETESPTTPGAPNAPTAPNALIITMDTLRADHIAPYGDAQSRTAAMQRLASEGTLFENAMSPMQMTRPSHGSLLTSLYPRDHGIVNNKIALDSQFRSLARVFRDAGYATAAFTAVKLLAPGSGFEQGFDHFDAPREARTRDARAVIDAAEQWLAARPAGQPFFVWLHLFDPHTPYAPPEDLRPAATPGPGGDLASAGIEELIALSRNHGGDLPGSAVERAKALYRGDIEYADRELGRLLSTLERDALLDRTAIVLTADHGECFENGIYFEHSDCLYEGAARIPLIFRFADRVARGVRRDEVVEILDVAPTLLSLLDLDVPAAFLGRRLFDATSKAREAAFLQHP
ncbi:MAG: sulfatase, partial [Myxococcota bacterium]|nr:sulfatase [Myxococcota bacterium]